ncbi:MULTISPECIES: response regulator transcription factor [unclassified Microcoleus]|uniref:response regulator transcription factor n=1 Tax=unclassified Microcoleus TaxID=2642155 RepID=UPI002FD14E11
MTISTDPHSKILVVDNDAPVRSCIGGYLNETYQVQSAADAKTALEIFEEFNPILVILDGNLPDNIGVKLCEEMQKRKNVFLLVIFSSTGEEARIKIIKAGIDDFICQPFILEDLALKIEILLSEMKTVSPRNLVFGELAIDLMSREVRLKEKTLALTALEFQLLYFLATYPGKAWSRQQLIEKVWGWKCNDARDEQVVDVYIRLIRRKLAKVDSAVPNFIQTTQGYGYTFAPIDRNNKVSR